MKSIVTLLTYTRLRVLLFVVCLGFGLLKAWTFRYYITADTISYADLTVALRAGNWSALFNTYWGPLLPLITAAIGVITRSSDTFLTLHLVTTLIFVAALLSFDWFWTGLGSSNEWSLPRRLPRLWLVTGYAIFILSFISLVPNVTPDIMVATVLFLFAGLFCRPKEVTTTARHSSAIGALAALGFWAKSVMFPLGFFAILLYFLFKPHASRLKFLVVSLAIFLIVALPLVWQISKQVHHFSFGTSGPLNYYWNVDSSTRFDAGATFFIGGDAVSQQPVVYRYPVLPGASFYPWYDPGRVEHSKPQPEISKQLQVLKTSAKFVRQLMVNERSALLLCVFIFAGMSLNSFKSGLTENWPLMTLAVAGFVVYAIVVLIYRYIVGFELILWGALLSSCRIGSSATRVRVAKTALIGALALLLISEGGMLGAVFTKLNTPLGFDQAAVAKSLIQNGIRKGDRVAVLGRALEQGWPHLTSTSIAFEVPPAEVETYWKLDNDRRRQIINQIREAGVTYIVSASPVPSDQQFTTVPGTSYAYEKLQ